MAGPDKGLEAVFRRSARQAICEVSWLSLTAVWKPAVGAPMTGGRERRLHWPILGVGGCGEIASSVPCERFFSAGLHRSECSGCSVDPGGRTDPIMGREILFHGWNPWHSSGDEGRLGTSFQSHLAECIVDESGNYKLHIMFLHAYIHTCHPVAVKMLILTITMKWMENSPGSQEPIMCI